MFSTIDCGFGVVDDEAILFAAMQDHFFLAASLNFYFHAYLSVSVVCEEILVKGDYLGQNIAVGRYTGHCLCLRSIAGVFI